MIDQNQYDFFIRITKKILPNYDEYLPLEDQLESLQLVSLIIEVETALKIEIPTMLARQIFMGTAETILKNLAQYYSKKSV